MKELVDNSVDACRERHDADADSCSNEGKIKIHIKKKKVDACQHSISVHLSPNPSPALTVHHLRSYCPFHLMQGKLLQVQIEDNGIGFEDKSTVDMLHFFRLVLDLMKN